MSGGNSDKFSKRKALSESMIYVPKLFRSTEIYIAILILKKTIFITFQVFSGKVSSETGVLERLEI